MGAAAQASPTADDTATKVICNGIATISANHRLTLVLKTLSKDGATLCCGGLFLD
ncbi:hypothetical protein [Anaplasma ovis]|uniref:hypothetical protein n=1 Tax=Anaplasma ovis TaxID=142058 RepID=UPI000B273EB0|nr:hypothetical protein [Anaplasma ovis]